MKQISVQLYTLRKRMETPQAAKETLKALGKMGLRWVQPTIPTFWSAKEFAAELADAGLQADSFSSMATDLSAIVKELCQKADALGTRKVRIGMISQKQASSKDEVMAYVEAINRHTSLLKKEGLVCLYHFHDYEFVSLGETTAMDLIVANAQELTYQPDVHWLAAAGYSPQEKLRTFRGKCEYVHIQDYGMLPDEQGNIVRTTVPVGRGNLHLPGILQTCKQMDVALYVIEQDDCQKDELASVKESVDTLLSLGIV